MEGYDPDIHMAFIDSSNSPWLKRDFTFESTIGNVGWWFTTWDLIRQPLIAQWIKSQPFRTVFGDELHTIKRWEAQRTKAAIRVTRHIPRRVGLTGSPITNEVMDVWSQCMFIDNGRTFGDNAWKFRLQYYIKAEHHGGWYPKREAKAQIQKKLKRIAIHVHEDDVLKLPPVRQFVKSCAMTGMQRRLTEQVIRDWEVEVSNKVIELNLTITKLQKLQQIAAGFVYKDDEDRTPTFINTNKWKLLMDLLKDPDYFGRKKKIVIWGTYHAELYAIAKQLAGAGIGFARYYGDYASPKARVRFRDNPAVRVFLGQVDRGVGMNELIVADTAIYCSNSQKVVSRQQSLRRIRRKGSEIHKAITYCDLVVEDTVEMPLLKRIKGGVDFAKSITDALKHGEQIRSILTRG